MLVVGACQMCPLTQKLAGGGNVGRNWGDRPSSGYWWDFRCGGRWVATWRQASVLVPAQTLMGDAWVVTRGGDIAIDGAVAMAVAMAM